MGGVSEEILIARAYLNRLAEPGNIPLWSLVRRVGPQAAAEAIRDGTAGAEVTAATQARAASADPLGDLAAAERHGIRLLVPESDDWPHFALSALERTGTARAIEYFGGETSCNQSGEPVPPLALWARGPADPAVLSVRSVGIVGARAATDYGTTVARGLAEGLAGAGFMIVSGGAYGIDAAAHVGALRAGGPTVVVSAGGLDRAYPAGNTALFDRIVQTGLLLSESPPGCAPQRRRFLTRNRLIASFSTGTVLVEAAARSGALNTIGHCGRLARPIMAVPGPVTSNMSRGCHDVLARERAPAALVTCVEDVIAIVGGSSDIPISSRPATGQAARVGLRERLDLLDDSSRIAFDGFPVGRAVTVDELVIVTGLGASELLGALPVLELAGLVEPANGGFRIPPARSIARRGP